jgi:hypothetical protein
MLRRLVPLCLLTLAALACSLGGGAAPNTVATNAAATLTALAASSASATPAANSTATPAAANPSETPAAAASATIAATTAAGTEAATEAATPAETAAASETPSATGCNLAYASGDTLFCLPEGGTPQTLATGAGMFGPAISPDGTLIAYSIVITDGVTQLWVASVAEGGEAPHLLVGQEQLPSADGSQVNSPNHYQWLAGTHTLVFDTRYIPISAGGPGEYINADLWTVQADTGALVPVLPAGQAGAFAASPDGTTIAISRGTGLDLINVDGSNHKPNVVTFPLIVTYSEYTFKPRPQWSTDGSYFTVAIPSHDPMAADASVTFYKVGTDGTATTYNTVPGNFVFGGLQPQIAPSGGYAVYSRNDPAGGPDMLHMLTIGPGTPEDTVFDTQPSPAGWGWSPDSAVYAYSVVPSGGGGKAYATAPGVESPHAFAADLTGLKDLRWLNGSRVVFLGQSSGGPWTLYRTISGGDPGGLETLVLGLTEETTFDVRP